MFSAPSVSAPIWAKAVLHDSWRMTKRVPPHDPPPKFPIGWPSAGGLYASVTG